MKKSILFTILTVFSLSAVFAQVPQRIVVEHFTNTRCGNCASRNPGLFTNLDNNKDVLHMAVHPSSPYSSCVLSQHNKTENDDRTKFYSVFGGTPRIAINGEVQGSSVNFSSSTLFDNYKKKRTPISISVNVINFSGDSIVSTIVIKAVSAHSLGEALLYVPFVEDSLEYSAPNGEKLHHNVFRKVLLSKTITLPANGDSLIITARTAGNVNWVPERLRTMVFIQNSSDKKFIQAEKSEAPKFTISSIGELVGPSFTFYPNPSFSELEVTLTNNLETELIITTLDGKKVFNTITNQVNNTLDISTLENGIYFISIHNSKGKSVKRFVKSEG